MSPPAPPPASEVSFTRLPPRLPSRWRRLILLPLLLLGLALAWQKPIDAAAEREIEAGLQRALVTFAAARALNGLISVVQSASFGVQIGAGASVQPGAVLDPLDDLVEQFSLLMLGATLSLATQRLLIELSGAWPLALLLSAALLAWAVLRWRGRAMPAWLPRLALALLCLRLAVPLVALASEASYRLLLAGDYQAAQAQIEAPELPGAEPRADESLAERMRRWWAQGADIGRKIELLKERADGLVEHLLRLAAVFLVQTLLLPLGFLWALLQVFRWLARGPMLGAWRSDG